MTKKDAHASLLVRFAYTRDAAGNPIAIERESGLGVFYYEYDALQRLTYEGQFVSAVREYENYYEYDLAGNRTLLRHGESGADDLTYYDYNAANELTSLHDAGGWTYYGYDANGNTVMEQTPDHTRYYDWDGRDMMVGVRSTEPGWPDNVIRYDGMASRAELVDSGGTTRYTWDGIRVLKTEDDVGTLKQRQVHGQSPSGNRPCLRNRSWIRAAALVSGCVRLHRRATGACLLRRPCQPPIRTLSGESALSVRRPLSQTGPPSVGDIAVVESSG